MAEQDPTEDRGASEAGCARRFVSQFGELVREGHVRPEPRMTIALLLLAAAALAMAVHDLLLQ